MSPRGRISGALLFARFDLANKKSWRLQVKQIAEYILDKPEYAVYCHVTDGSKTIHTIVEKSDIATPTTSSTTGRRSLHRRSRRCRASIGADGAGTICIVCT